MSVKISSFDSSIDTVAHDSVGVVTFAPKRVKITETLAPSLAALP